MMPRSIRSQARPTTTVLLIATATLAMGQCAWNTDLVNATAQIATIDASLRPAGGAFLITDDYWGDVVLVRTELGGPLVWSKRYPTTDPTVRLSTPNWSWPTHSVLATPDGGALVFGIRTEPGLYSNMFGIKVDPAGAVEWARIYMGAGPAAIFDPFRVPPLAASHPGGGYVFAYPMDDGLCISRIDAQGLPLWTKRYVDQTTPTIRAHELIVEADEEIMLAGHAMQSNGQLPTGPLLVHLLPNGDLDWSYRYGLNPDERMTMTAAPNGDYLLAGFAVSGLLRADPTGTALLFKDYSAVMPGAKAYELSNGDIFIASIGGFNQIAGLRVQSNGTVLNQGHLTSLPHNEGPVGMFSDTLVIARWGVDAISQNLEPQLLTVDVASGMPLCAYTPATPVSITSSTLPSRTAAPIDVYADTLKTWTLSLFNSIGMDQMDLTCAMSSGPARPGFQHNIYASTLNQLGAPTGTIAASLTFDPQLTYISATPGPTTVVGNVITWDNLPSLDGFNQSMNSIHVITQVPAGLAIGIPVTHTMTVTPDSVDIDLANNTTTITRIVSNSYDPNDKLVWPASAYDMTTDTILDYTIRFQNTGTDTAFTVVVRDTLPSEVSVGSFVQGAASHLYTLAITAEGVVTWTFNNILLPDSNTNEPLSHGLVSFRIKPDAGLMPGTVISNEANIYFDFNPPILTPTASVVLTMPTEVPALHPDQLLMYPVPVHDLLTVELPETFVPEHMRVTSMEGREVSYRSLRNATGKVAFPTQDLAPGIYLLTVQDRDGQLATARFVKE